MNNVQNPGSYRSRCLDRTRGLARLLTTYAAAHDPEAVTHYCDACREWAPLRPWRSVLEPGRVRLGPWLCETCRARWSGRPALSTRGGAA